MFLLNFAVKRIKGEKNIFSWLKFCLFIEKIVQNYTLSLLTEYCNSTVRSLCPILFLWIVDCKLVLDSQHTIVDGNSGYQVIQKLKSNWRKLVIIVVLPQIHTEGEQTGTGVRRIRKVIRNEVWGLSGMRCFSVQERISYNAMAQCYPLYVAPHWWGFSCLSRGSSFDRLQLGNLDSDCWARAVRPSVLG